MKKLKVNKSTIDREGGEGVHTKACYVVGEKITPERKWVSVDWPDNTMSVLKDKCTNLVGYIILTLAKTDLQTTL